MVRKDCKFYNPNSDDCSALIQLFCAIEEKPCSFFKENPDSCYGQKCDELDCRECGKRRGEK